MRKGWEGKAGEGDRAAPTPLGHCCRVGPSETLGGCHGEHMGMGWGWNGYRVGMGCSISTWHRGFDSFLPRPWHLQQSPPGSVPPRGAKGGGDGLAEGREEKRCSAPGLVLLRPSQRTTRLGDALDKTGVLKEGFWKPKYLAGRRAEVMP